MVVTLNNYFIAAYSILCEYIGCNMAETVSPKAKEKITVRDKFCDGSVFVLDSSIVECQRVKLVKVKVSPESGFLGFSDKCEMCLKVVGGNNYIFM